MAKIVVVHGIGQEFSGWNTMKTVVAPAVLDGVRMADRCGISLEDVDCAFYGNLFFASGAKAASGGLPPWDERHVETEFESELLAAWWASAAAIDSAVPDPQAAGKGRVAYAASRPLNVPRVRSALGALSRSEFFARVGDRGMIFALKQVRRYFTDPGLRRSIRAAVAESIDERTRVVVGHSLGSVVAYETLCDPEIRAANPGWQVDALVTLGSPLGLGGLVFDRLEPAPQGGRGEWPRGIKAWTNISDPGDVVAMPDMLRPLFATGGPGTGVEDRSVRNGAMMHDIGRYLRAPVTGAVIADGLVSDGIRGTGPSGVDGARAPVPEGQ